MTLARSRRLLAECDAKRQAVEWFNAVESARITGPAGETAAYTALGFLALLALPYADHRDYDEAWRP